MTRYTGLCIRGPKHGLQLVEEKPKVMFPEYKAPSMFLGEEPDHNTPVTIIEHWYHWDDEYKYWVYQG